jgi:competence protein ComEA
MRKNMFLRNQWKEYLSFPRRLRNGLYVLLLIILLQIGFLLYVKYTPSTNQPADISEFQKEIDAFYTSIKNDSGNNNTSFVPAHSDNEVQKAELFVFNPNNLPESDWKSLGFSEKQIRVIKNYESKGGRFRTKADVKKMYCISAEEYAMIEPYINIPQQTKDTSTNRPSYAKYKRPFLIVDIGTADSVELLKLPAIGSAFARRISNYREKLGGFYSINQLKEVWGLTDSIFQIIFPHVVLNDTSHLMKIDINKAGYKEFNIHPYIDGNLANAIVAYRNQHGFFHTIEDIKKVALLNGELYTKLAPYLKIE